MNTKGILTERVFNLLCDVYTEGSYNGWNDEKEAMKYLRTTAIDIARIYKELQQCEEEGEHDDN